MDTTVADMPGTEGGKSHVELVMFVGEGLPSGSVLPYQSSLPLSESGAEGKT